MPIIPEQVIDKIVSFASGATAELTSNDAAWTAKARIIYCGTTRWGNLKTLKITGRVDSGCTGRIRIQDITNSQTIATSATLNSTSVSVIDLGTVSNVPASEAIFEIQMIRDTGTGGSMVRCSSLLLISE